MQKPYQRRHRRGGGEGAPSGILLLHGREMSCEVKVEMWWPLCESNGSYFETGRDADGNVGDELEH